MKKIITFLFLAIFYSTVHAQSQESNNLYDRAMSLYKSSDYSAALTLFEECVKLDKEEIDSTSYRIQHSSNALAACYYKLGLMEKLETLNPYYIYDDPIDRNLTIVIDSLIDATTFFASKNDFKNSLECSQQAYTAGKEIFGENSPILFSPLFMMGVSKHNIGETKESINDLLEAHRILKLHTKPQNPSFFVLEQNLNYAFFLAHNFPSALEWAENMLEYSFLYAPDDVEKRNVATNTVLYMLTQMGRASEMNDIVERIASRSNVELVDYDVDIKHSQALALIADNKKEAAAEILASIGNNVELKYGRESIQYSMYLKNYADAIADKKQQLKLYEESFNILEQTKKEYIGEYIMVGTLLGTAYISNHDSQRSAQTFKKMKDFLNELPHEIADTLSLAVTMGEMTILFSTGQFVQAAEALESTKHIWGANESFYQYYLLTGWTYSLAGEYAKGKRYSKKGFENLDIILNDHTKIHQWKNAIPMLDNILHGLDISSYPWKVDSVNYAMKYIESECYRAKLKAYERLNEYGLTGNDSIGCEKFMVTLRNFALLTCDKSNRGDRSYGMQVLQHYIDLLEKRFGYNSYERFRAWEIMLSYCYDKENRMPEELYNRYVAEASVWNKTRKGRESHLSTITNDYETKNDKLLRELSEMKEYWKEHHLWRDLAESYKKNDSIDLAIEYYERYFLEELNSIKDKSSRKRKDVLRELYGEDAYGVYGRICCNILNLLVKKGDYTKVTDKLECLLKKGDAFISKQENFWFWINILYSIDHNNNDLRNHIVEYMNTNRDKYAKTIEHIIITYRLQANLLAEIGKEQEAFDTMAYALELIKKSSIRNKKNITLDYQVNLLYYEYKYMSPNKERGKWLLLKLYEILYSRQKTEWRKLYAYVCQELASHYAIYEENYDKAIFYGEACLSVQSDEKKHNYEAQDGTEWIAPFNNQPGDYVSFDLEKRYVDEWYLEKGDESHIASYFQYEKERIIDNVMRADAYFYTYESFIHKMTDFGISVKSPSVIKYAYDAALLGKGIRLTSQNALKTMILKGDNYSLQDLYNQWLNVNDEIAKYKDATPDSLNRLNRQLEEQLFKSSSIFGDFKNQFNISWKDIQDKLGVNEVAIEFTYCYKEGYNTLCAIWITKNKEPQIVKLCDEWEINRNKDKWYIDSSLYESIWQPILKNLDNTITKIYFSPYGIINSIAIESVYNSTGLLSNQYNIIRLSSTKEIVKSSNKEISTGALLYGNLDYNRFEGHESNKDSIVNIFRNATANANLRDMVSRGAIQEIPILPGTANELKNVTTCLSDANIPFTSVMGKEGTESSVRELAPQGYSIIHFATHGFYEESTDNNNMVNSGLLMAGAIEGLASSELSGNDGILTSQEISTLDLTGLDLVVLSACETAKGGINSDGVFGLQRGFKKAGANSILMSLWKVDDAATCKLMTEFYSNWIGKKMTKHDALEAAKKTVREVKGWEDPKYWAAFILLDGLD